jgi:hypothetical protein
MSKLLINEPPLQVLPSLAAAIGLSEAIVLQQVHYWISNPKVGEEHDGRHWVYNSVRQWQEDNFRFWSERHIKRLLDKLCDMGLLLRANYNKRKYDRTHWYTIDYDALELVTQTDARPIMTNCHNGLRQDVMMHHDEMSQPIPETTAENTTETTIIAADEDSDCDTDNNDASSFSLVKKLHEEVIGEVNAKTEKKLRAAVCDYPADWFQKAFDIAADGDEEQQKWRYVRGILRNWKARGQPYDLRDEQKTSKDERDALREAMRARVDAYVVHHRLDWHDCSADEQKFIRHMGREGGVYDLRRMTEKDYDIRFRQTFNELVP